MGFWGWHELVQLGLVSLARASVTITMYDLTGNTWAVWDLDKAWPSKVSGPQLNAGENEVGIEELTLVHEGLKRVDTGWTSVLMSFL
jgi:phage tail-like protein